MERLKQSLDLYNMNTLKVIAENLNVAPAKPPVRKAWLVDALDAKIREVAKSPSFIKVLSEAERATLGILLKNGGTGTQRDAMLPLMMAGLIYIEGQDATIDQPRFRRRVALTDAQRADRQPHRPTRHIIAPHLRSGLPIRHPARDQKHVAA